MLRRSFRRIGGRISVRRSAARSGVSSAGAWRRSLSSDGAGASGDAASSSSGSSGSSVNYGDRSVHELYKNEEDWNAFLAHVRETEKADKKTLRTLYVDEFEAGPGAALQIGNTREAYGMHQDAGAIGLPGLLDRYGILPLVGFGLAIGVSKEFLLLNEELIVVGTFSSFVAAAYTAIGESVSSGFDQEYQDSKKEWEAAFDKYIDNMQAGADFWSDWTTLNMDLDAYFNKINEQRTELRKLAPFKVQHAFTKTIERALQRIYTAERNYTGAQSSKLRNEASELVLAELQNANDATKKTLFDAALDRIQGKNTDKDTDLVRDLYLKHVRALDAAAKKARASEEIELSDEEFAKLKAWRDNMVAAQKAIGNDKVKVPEPKKKLKAPFFQPLAFVAN